VSYQPYLAILRRRFLLVLLITVVGAGSAAFFAMRQPRIYQATATLLINPAAPNQAIPYLQAALAGSQSSIQQLASTYDVFLTSPGFDQQVVNSLGLPESAGALAGQITTQLVSTTNFYRISVAAGEPQLAQQLANAVAKQFIAANVSVLQEAQASAARPTPGPEVLQRLVKEIGDVSALDQRLANSPNANSPAVQQELAATEQRLSALTTAYNQLQTSQSGSTNTAQLNTATLTSPATLPTVPISPSVRKDVMLGGAAGLSLGLILAFVLEFVEYTIRTPEELEEATGSLPIAVIAAVGNERRLRRENQHPAAQLYTMLTPHSGVSEAFRTLRTNLAFSALNTPVRTILVCSVLPGEGKSTVAANLAVVLAQSGKRVVLVDADLRRPSLHSVFNVGRGHGLTDLLLNGGDIAANLRQTTVPNLRLLPCGTIPPNPAELLSSDAMKPLIIALKNHADLVIFDSPPMGALTDAVVLSTLTEGSLMVVKAGLARPNVVKRGLETLHKVGSRPLGIVLNRVTVSQLRDYSYYYYYAQSGEYAAEEGEREAVPSEVTLRGAS
jgi:capsular exopolysaccharide synthesis family protein